MLSLHQSNLLRLDLVLYNCYHIYLLSHHCLSLLNCLQYHCYLCLHHLPLKDRKYHRCLSLNLNGWVHHRYQNQSLLQFHLNLNHRVNLRLSNFLCRRHLHLLLGLFLGLRLYLKYHRYQNLNRCQSVTPSPSVSNVFVTV